MSLHEFEGYLLNVISTLSPVLSLILALFHFFCFLDLLITSNAEEIPFYMRLIRSLLLFSDLQEALQLEYLFGDIE